MFFATVRSCKWDLINVYHMLRLSKFSLAPPHLRNMLLAVIAGLILISPAYSYALPHLGRTVDYRARNSLQPTSYPSHHEESGHLVQKSRRASSSMQLAIDTTVVSDRWDATYFSPAKVNLFLRILEKRQDGFHDLASLFQVKFEAFLGSTAVDIDEKEQL